MAIQNNGDNPDYLFERINQTQYHYLEKLFFDVFQTTITIKQIEKKFNTKGLGAEVIGYLALLFYISVCVSFIYLAMESFFLNIPLIAPQL